MTALALVRPADTSVVTAGAARFTLTPRDLRDTRPAPLMRPPAEDWQRTSCPRVPRMTFLEVLAALYGFGRLEVRPPSVAQLRAELSRIVDEHGMPAIRETARWIWFHGEGVRTGGPCGIEYGIHALVLRMSGARVQAGKLCSAYGDTA